MKYLYLLSLSFLFSCNKYVKIPSEPKPIPQLPVNNNITQTPNVHLVSSLDSISTINKTSSWYLTNKSFDELLGFRNSPFWGFQSTINGYISFQTNRTADYWNDYGTYIYTDLNGDGSKDLWSYYYKSPWPTNSQGLCLFTELKNGTRNFHIGLTQVRKAVVSDIDNDGKKEIVMFSHGYDKEPFPGDSIGIFYPNEVSYQYLPDEVGFFHAGAVGDINNDGLVDIIGYGVGGSAKLKTPTVYLNQGNRKFKLSKTNTINFNLNDGYMSMELYDIDNDGYLDMILGNGGIIKIIKNKNGVFDMSSAKNIQNDGMPLSFIFYDFNKDGNVDILTTNTYTYNGFNIKLYINDNQNFVDQTSKYFDMITNNSTGTWIKWIRLFDYDKDGDLDVVGDGLYGTILNNTIHWKNNKGTFNFILN
jgi:hypothetical protein